MHSLEQVIAIKAFEQFDSPAIFTDTTGRLIWCNSAFEKLTEYRLDEVLGKTPGSFLQGPDSDPIIIKTISNAVKAQRGFEVEIENYSKSGKKYTTQISCEAVFDSHNKHLGFFSIQPRVTRKKLIEEKKLLETQLLLEAIVNNAEAAVIIADDNMVVRKVNLFACKMLGYTEDELVGMNVMDYTRKVITTENLWNEFMEQNTQVGEIELLHKSGSVVYTQYKAVANVMPGKHLSVIMDISERKRHEREIISKNRDLAEANKAMNTLFSIIGHDLQSPLLSLQSALELLDIPDVKPEEFKKLFEGIADVLDTNRSMLNNLLSWANQQKGGFKMKSANVDLKELILEQYHAHNKRAKDKGVSIELELPNEAVNVFVDPDAIRLVLRNLCSNAIKYCSAGDTIKVMLTLEPNSVITRVIDSGKGISSENLEKIFSTGFSTTGSKNEKGTGIGLTLCNEFLNHFSSELKVESELGKGTEFYFGLPI